MRTKAFLLMVTLLTCARLATSPAEAAFDAAFVEKLCYHGAYTLSAIEEPGYMAAPSVITYTQQTPWRIYQFKRLGDGETICTDLYREERGSNAYSVCSEATVTKADRQLLRSGWTLVSCPGR